MQRRQPTLPCAQRFFPTRVREELFAGISLEGSTTLRPDNDANEKLYGKKVTATGNHPSGCGGHAAVRAKTSWLASEEVTQESV